MASFPGHMEDRSTLEQGYLPIIALQGVVLSFRCLVDNVKPTHLEKSSHTADRVHVHQLHGSWTGLANHWREMAAEEQREKGEPRGKKEWKAALT